MSAAPLQLAFDLPVRAALGADDFMISPANAAALALVDQWPDWPLWAAVVAGPASAGKSHLANVWRYRSQALSTRAQEISESLVARFMTAQALVVEDLHEGVADEQMLFHLLNLAREHRLSILFTSRVAPGELSIAFPDLRSRLRALPLVSISEPDDPLLEAVLVKHFADRQLTVEPAVISFAIRHMERSFAGAARIVEAIDRRSLAAKRRVTKALANDAIMELSRSPNETGDAAGSGE